VTAVFMLVGYSRHDPMTPRFLLSFAIGNVGCRARSWCQPRPCEFAGWMLVDAASSTAVALLQLLVVDALDICNLLCICGALLLQSTGTNAACQQTLVLASVTNSPIVMLRMRQFSLGASTLKRNVNGGLLGHNQHWACCCSARGIGGIRDCPTCSSRGE